MRQFLKTTGLIAAAGLCAPAIAQDSVSNNLGGFPGDALNQFTDNCNEYVIDLAEIVTSKGHCFGIAPIIKLSQSPDPAFFNNLNSASGISPLVRTGVPFPSPAYDLWENNPGAGTNTNGTNDAPGTINPQGNSTQFAVAMAEFGGAGVGQNYNGIVGAVVNYDPNDPNRLYVTRRQVAVNGIAGSTGDVSQFGGISVDADGNVMYRADNFGSSGIGGFTTVSGNNIFRTSMLSRNCGVSNLISGNPATSDATAGIVTGSATTLSAPSMIPASVSGTNALYAGPNFSTQYVYGDVGSVFSTSAHLDTTGGIGGDHRGTMGSTTFDFTGSGAAYHFAIYSKDAAFDTTVLNAFGVSATGAVVSNLGLQVPTSITDNETGFTVNYIPGTYEFRNYASQVSFRGGVGNIAIGGDQNGDGLMAATMYEFGASGGGFNDDFSNQIVVARRDSATGAVSWTLAAYVDALNIGTPNTGKPICDSTGATIGQIVDLPAVTGGTPLGPGMSAPAIDSVGNIWFSSSVELFNRIDTDGDTIGDTSDFDSALIRAIYNPTTFSYELELVLELGQVITGLNSGTDYQISFLGQADSNSISSGTIFSNAAAEVAWNNSPTTGLDTSDPITNGGVFFGTDITYDTNGDGVFNDPSSGNFNPSFPADESYVVGMFVGYYDKAVPCPADFNGDGTTSFPDVGLFLAAFSTGDPAADFNGDGSTSFPDVGLFLAAFSAGCP